jgi:SNF2 family DNA or RNA helicase
MTKVLDEEKKLAIFVMNIEALATAKGRQFAERFVRRHQTMMVVDESTAIKNPKAKRTKACIELGQHARFRRILTGTPVTASPLDLYSQCQFLDRRS